MIFNLRETPSNNGVMSVVCLSMGWEETQNILQKQFQSFIIESKGMNTLMLFRYVFLFHSTFPWMFFFCLPVITMRRYYSSQTKECICKRIILLFITDNEVHVGIFLPPLQHLLLKFSTRNQKTVVAIATDDWRILGLVEKYLREVEQQ